MRIGIEARRTDSRKKVVVIVNQFFETVKYKLGMQDKRFEDLKFKSGDTYRRWAKNPEKASMQDLALLLKQLGISKEDQEQMVLLVYRNLGGN